MPMQEPKTPQEVSEILTRVQATIGYQLRNTSNLPFLWLALQGSSDTFASQTGLSLEPPIDPKGNRSLALLGDKVHAFIIASASYERGVSPKHMHKTISALGKNKFFDLIGRAVCLEDYVQTGASLDPNQGGVRIVANAIEGIMGALYLDGGVTAVETMMTKLDMWGDLQPGCKIPSTFDYQATRQSPDTAELLKLRPLPQAISGRARRTSTASSMTDVSATESESGSSISGISTPASSVYPSPALPSIEDFDEC